MARTLLLCFIHGFKGTDNTFQDFPSDLKKAVAQRLPEDHVESVVYPKYETKGELSEATEAFLEWLKGRVMDIRKKRTETPWPPNDREVGVVLVAHSMGGFVAADALFLALNERSTSASSESPIFPPIQGILTFDTPYNGLARSMFVYGAFSNYQKVSNVFNVMTALSAAAPAGLARLGTRNTVTSTMPTSREPQWKAWQLVAVRTGTVGAIAAGGVAAYMNREAIFKGVKSVKNLNKESVVEGYRQSMDALGQGLAYVNRGNVGKSFAWLSDHFTFVGALLKQNELSSRLERMGALKGIGIHDFYCSLGENGYWSGGYFVPERTFCAVPEEGQPAHNLFTRHVMPKADDEMKAHLTMFRPEKNEGYDEMLNKSADLAHGWFLAEDEIVDDPSIQTKQVDEKEENVPPADILENPAELSEKINQGGDDEQLTNDLPDESPIDIAAAASLVPLPDEEGDLLEEASAEDSDTPERRNYLNHLFQVAQQAGTGLAGVRGWLPSKMPQMPSVPSMPKIPSSVSSLGQVQVPGAGIFSKKSKTKDDENKENGSKDEGGQGEADQNKSEKVGEVGGEQAQQG